jgi:hypothetical protein
VCSLSCGSDYLTKHPPTDVSKSCDWIKKIDDLHKIHPTERDKIEEREFNSFGDLATIASLVQSLFAVLALPFDNSNKLKGGHIYESRSQKLVLELSFLKVEVDLSSFANLIDNLLEPGMAEEALRVLDEFIIEKTGSSMGFLCQDLIESCILDVIARFEQNKAKTNEHANVVIPPTLVESPAPEFQIQQRRQKEKSRPAHSSIYDILAPKNSAHRKSKNQPKSLK